MGVDAGLGVLLRRRRLLELRTSLKLTLETTELQPATLWCALGLCAVPVAPATSRLATTYHGGRPAARHRPGTPGDPGFDLRHRRPGAASRNEPATCWDLLASKSSVYINNRQPYGSLSNVLRKPAVT